MKTNPAPVNPLSRRPGRPVKPGSKRSNPDYRPWSGLLRGQYVRDADIVLKQTDDPRDMSDLITELLGKWVSERNDVKEATSIGEIRSVQFASDRKVAQR